MPRTSLFWFKADARFAWKDKESVVRRARQPAQAMGEGGVEVRELHTYDPGGILWVDVRQAIASPSGTIPRAF